MGEPIPSSELPPEGIPPIGRPCSEYLTRRRADERRRDDLHTPTRESNVRTTTMSHRRDQEPQVGGFLPSWCTTASRAHCRWLAPPSRHARLLLAGKGCASMRGHLVMLESSISSLRRAADGTAVTRLEII